MALEGQDGVERLSFDLPGRRLTALHRGEAVALAARLRPLGLGARLVETGPAAHAEAAGADASAAVTSSVRAELDASDPAWTQFAATDASETGTLRVLLGANAACLVLVFRHRHGGAHMKAS